MYKYSIISLSLFATIIFSGPSIAQEGSNCQTQYNYDQTAKVVSCGNANTTTSTTDPNTASIESLYKDGFYIGNKSTTYWAVTKTTRSWSTTTIYTRTPSGSWTPNSTSSSPVQVSSSVTAYRKVCYSYVASMYGSSNCSTSITGGS